MLVISNLTTQLPIHREPRYPARTPENKAYRYTKISMKLINQNRLLLTALVMIGLR